MQSTNVRQGKRGYSGSSIYREYVCEFSHGACGCHQEEEGADLGDDTRLGRRYSVESVSIQWLGAGRQLLS